MVLLFLGDVVGEIGSKFVASKLRTIKNYYGVDVTVVNGENSANGNGITPYSAITVTEEKKYMICWNVRNIFFGRQIFRRAIPVTDTAYMTWEAAG